ncbi:hypothetical protein C6558_11350 [Ensifer sp. NM-2]|nr:hypothetical protein C6558_11350 [Ensifer sp. NM-2]
MWLSPSAENATAALSPCGNLAARLALNCNAIVGRRLCWRAGTLRISNVQSAPFADAKVE